MKRKVGLVLVGLLALVTVSASYISPHDPARQFEDFVQAPPMRPRIVDQEGRLRAPFVYPLRLVDRLERRFEEDRSRRLPLRMFSDSTLFSVDEQSGPWLPFGGDALGRDVFARLTRGARLSLGVAALSALVALLLGGIVGATAGFAGGRIDELLMRAADLVLILPAIYLVLTLRAAMPLVLTEAQVFWTMTGVFAMAGWPYPARGVRAVVAAERRKEYAEAARAIGAGPWRILLRHLLPAARGFLAVQLTLLVPGFILAEATLSFVGFGFAEPVPSWGLMLQDAARVSVLSEAPWLLAPAVAIVFSVLALHLVGNPDSQDPGVMSNKY
jgi:peptide/nickel transport system permease protein